MIGGSECISILRLFIIIIIIIAICIRFSHELLAPTHNNNFSTTLYWALYWRCCADFERQRQARLLISLMLVFSMSMLFLCWKLRFNRVTGFYVGLALAWKRLSTCLYFYYLVVINMISFNLRFVMFLLRKVLYKNFRRFDQFLRCYEVPNVSI